MNQKKKSRISHPSTCILSEYMNMNFDYHFSVFEYLILSKVRRVASASAYDEDVKFIRSNIIKSER